MPVPPAHRSPLRIDAALRHDAADRRIGILRALASGGSISEAARAVGISYKAAWQALDTLTNLAGVPLVERAVGGAGGGGAALTPAGIALLDAAQALDAARAEALARWGDAHALPTLGLRTSMRNQLPATVLALKRVDGMVSVSLAAGEIHADAPRLMAHITRESAELLGLRTGLRVLALCKATAVCVRALPSAEPLEAGIDAVNNRLAGTVERRTRATAGGRSEVVLSLAGAPGLHIVGFAGPVGQKETAAPLRVGSRALAVFELSAVVVALAA